MKTKQRQWLYHPEKGARLFEPGEDCTGWYDTPDKFPKKRQK